MHSARVLIVPLLLGLAFSSVPAAAAAVPTGNQLRNGDAETGAGSTDSSTTAPVPIPFWTTTGNFTEHVYDPAGSGAFPDVNAGRKIGGGHQFFAGGPQSTDNTTERATQVVDLSPSAADVDRGGVSAALAADLGGFADQGDNARVSATFQVQSIPAVYAAFPCARSWSRAAAR